MQKCINKIIIGLVYVVCTHIGILGIFLLFWCCLHYELITIIVTVVLFAVAVLVYLIIQGNHDYSITFFATTVIGNVGTIGVTYFVCNYIADTYQWGIFDQNGSALLIYWYIIYWLSIGLSVIFAIDLMRLVIIKLYRYILNRKFSETKELNAVDNESNEQK